jgi:hypothetical protein
MLGDILNDPEIFHFTRRSASGGVATGLFVAFLPVPGQTLIAALLAIHFRLNLPLAILFSWTSNPLTIPPLFYLCYRTGSYLLDVPARAISFEFSYSWFTEKIISIWQPLILGGLLIGSLTALCGYISVRLLWRLAVWNKWDKRRRSKSGSKK